MKSTLRTNASLN